MCEGLGLDVDAVSSQKAETKPWATVVMNTMVAEDGKKREVVVHRSRLPSRCGWPPSSRAASARAFAPSWSRTRRSAPAFCAITSSGSVMSRLPPAVFTEAQLQALEQTRRPNRHGRCGGALGPLTKAFAKALAETPSGTISRFDALWLKREVCVIARLQFRAGLATGKTQKGAEASARRRIYNRLGHAVSWSGSGCDWAALGADRFPEARAVLVELRREAERLVPSAQERQLSLLPGGKS